MKKILYLSFYFEPDLCAGSFRNSPLAHELADMLTGKAEVHVITTLPNRYKSFVTECEQEEVKGNLKITRIKLPAHQSGFSDQVNSFRAYYFQARRATKNERYDLVIASSSRLFTAYLGYRIASEKKLPLYLDIRDIFTDTMSDVLQNKALRSVLVPVLKNIEKKVFEYASHVNLISPGFASYFDRYNIKNKSYFTNGIDDEFVTNEPLDIKQGPPYIITYAGNIGEGQGLHKIIPQMAAMEPSKYHYRIIGDGGAAGKLADEISRSGLNNVTLERPVKRKELLEIYKDSHFLFIHLNDYEAFKKVLPSKIFEAAAFPRPIIAGVGGYAREFLEQHVENALLFDPTNAAQIIAELERYEYKCMVRSGFIQRFARKNINVEMARSMIKYIQ